MAKRGRPTIYTKEKADEICSFVARGMPMRRICEIEGMPVIASVFSWLREYPEFLEQYALAKEEATFAMHETLDDIGDMAIDAIRNEDVDPKSSNALVSAYKLKADNLRWTMSKLRPKRYGDKIDHTTNGKDLPTPIMNVVQPNDSNNKDSEIE